MQRRAAAGDVQLLGFLYVGGIDGVRVYTKGGHDQKLLATIATGDRPPTGMYVTKNGDLYVGNGYDKILVYHRRALMPYRVLTGPDGVIGDVTVDVFGTVYAVEATSEKTTAIQVFAGGANAPTGELTDTLNAERVATDASGDLFVQETERKYSGAGRVLEYPAGGAGAFRLPIPQQDGAAGITVNAQGQLIVCNSGGNDGFNGSFFIYDPPYQSKPVKEYGLFDGIQACVADRSDDGIWIAGRGNVASALLFDARYGGVTDVIAMPGSGFIGKIAVDWL